MGNPREPSELFSALSDDLRLRILEVLQGGERCVSELVEQLGVPQYSVSRHLQILRRIGLLERHRAGRWVGYRVAPERDGLVRDALAVVRRWELGA